MTAHVKVAARAAWTSAELAADNTWLFPLDAAATADLERTVHRHRDAREDLLSLDGADVDLGAAGPVIARAVEEAEHGRGVALVRGLPREGLQEEDFALLTWLIGLRVGVARPQNKASAYLSPVRDVGTVYRSATGRGYSSNAELDFHVDGADLVALTCYNDAVSGGDSLCTSAIAAHAVIARERPDLLALLYDHFVYNRQSEEAPGQAPTFRIPVFAERDGQVFCTWARNRVEAAQTREEVPKLTAEQRAALDLLDQVVRRESLMFRMRLQPGDMQLLSNRTMLHSRTRFEDHEAPELKRLLYRLWLAPRGAVALPPCWAEAYSDTEPNTVRGGARGQHYDDRHRDFERRQAEALGMILNEAVQA